MGENRQEFVLGAIGGFGFGARGMLANQHFRAFFFGLFSFSYFQAQFGGVILCFGIEPRVLVRDCQLIGQRDRQPFVGFAEIFVVILIK